MPKPMVGVVASKSYSAAPRYGSGASRVSGMSASTSKRPSAPTDAEKQEHDGIAEHVRDIARNRGAEGGANADSDADDALREIEMSGAACGVGDDERHQHTERRRRNSVEELRCDDHGQDRSTRRRPRHGRTAVRSTASGEGGGPSFAPCAQPKAR